MKKIILGLMLGISLTSIVSCKCLKKDTQTVSENKESITNLNNTQWKLLRFDLENRDFKATEEVPQILLRFVDNTVSTSDGCNSHGGEYTQKDNLLEMGNLRTTMRHCDADFMKKNGYKVPVHTAKSFRIEKNHLYLLNAEGKTLATYIKIN